jgi:hypothetical protein
MILEPVFYTNAILQKLISLMAPVISIIKHFNCLEEVCRYSKPIAKIPSTCVSKLAVPRFILIVIFDPPGVKNTGSKE